MATKKTAGSPLTRSRVRQVAAVANVDERTVRSFLAGERQPQKAKAKAIETALRALQLDVAPAHLQALSSAPTPKA